MIPILYSADNTDFTSQGLGLISEVIKCHVSEQRNANYFLEIEVPVFSKRFKELKLERLIKVDDHNNTGQLFRIKSIGIPSQGMCSVYAEHISKDIEGYTINPEVQVSGPANQALEIWRKNLLEKDKVTVYSDITTSTPIRRWTIDEMENPMYCLGGKSGSILQLYKGEYQFDNLNIKLHQSRGFNTGASITYGRNMNDFSQDESIEEVANSIYPFAWKDEEGKENEDRQMIVLKNLYYDGPHIDKYAERRVFFVDFTDKKPKDVKELEKLAAKYVKDNNVGAPKVSITVNPILNGNLTEGLELKNFEQVNLCDIVTVKFDKLKINVQAKVNEVTYDVLNEKFVNYHLGDERRTLSNSLGKIETSVNNVGKEIQKVTGWAQQSADGKNTIFYGKEEPKAHKKGDTWFKETPNGIVINVWDGQIWLEVKTDFSEEFDKLDKELDVQKEKIEQSLKESQKAIEEAGFSKHSADEANKKAEQAIKEAGFSKGLSESTQKELINSQKELTIVKDSADKAIQDAEKALNTIENIEIGGRNYFLNSSKLDQTNVLPYSGSKLHLVTQNVEVSEWNTKTATNFQFTTTPINQIGVLIVGRNILYPERHYGEEFITSTYILNNGTVPFTISDNAGGNLVIPPKIPMRAIIKNPKATVGAGYQINITAQTTGINFTIWHPKMEVGNKATDHSPAPEDAELEIMKINGELTSKASQKDIDKLNQTVTNHEVSIKQNAKELEAKADNSIVDTINKTVKNQSSQIKLNSDALKLKAEKSYVDQKNSELDSKVSSEFTVQAGKISANSKDITEQGTKLGKLESSADKMVSELTELKNQEIGGRNYFPYTYTTGVENISSWSTLMILNKELNKTKLIPGETYRIRYSYRQEEDPTPYVPFSQNAHGTLLLYSGVEGHPNVYLGGLENNAEDAKTWKKGTIRTRQAVFTMPKDISMPTQYRIISYTFRAMKKDNPSTFVKNLTGTFFDIKIEKGDKYTDWSPAPEDNIEKLSKIEQTIDGIQETVKNKTDQSQTTQLAGQITTVIKDVNGNKTEILTTKNQIKELITSTDGRFVEVNKQLNGIQTTVKNKAEQTQVTTIAGQLTTVMKNVDGHEAKITANTKLINSKVSKGEVSSQINIESDNILIDTSGKLVLSAETIRIKGKSFLDAAVIKDLSVTSAKIANLSVTNAKIASLNVSKLTAGTINTGNIKIASTLEMTGENGTLNGHYDYDEPVGQAIRPRRFVGSWQLGRRLMRFVGETYDSETGKKYYTNTYFGQDQVKMRKYRNGDPNDIVGRIDMSVYKESRIDVVNDYSQIESVRSMTSMTGKGLQGRIIGAMSLTTRAGFNGESDHLSKFLYIYPVNTWNPGKSSHAFRIRYHGENSVKLYEINSTFIYNATGGGAYDVKISSNGNLKSSRGTYNTSNLNTIQRSSQAKAIVGDKSLSKIVNLTPTSWKKKIENKDSKLANLKTLSNQIQVGYTIEDLQKAGLDNCLVINEDTGEADDYRVELVLPYLVEAIKSLNEEVTQLKENKLEEYNNGNRNHTGRLAAVS